VRERGNILGYGKCSKPSHLNWEAFAKLILDSLPPNVADHYRDKISVFLRWYQTRGYSAGIPDEGPVNSREIPSWTRICKVLLRNDFWCKGLSFSQTKPEAYERYKLVMRKRRDEWSIM
jgi:predicted phosphoadenosine phosphosulfate sulfurtransferase